MTQNSAFCQGDQQRRTDLREFSVENHIWHHRRSIISETAPEKRFIRSSIKWLPTSIEWINIIYKYWHYTNWWHCIRGKRTDRTIIADPALAADIIHTGLITGYLCVDFSCVLLHPAILLISCSCPHIGHTTDKKQFIINQQMYEMINPSIVGRINFNRPTAYDSIIFSFILSSPPQQRYPSILFIFITPEYSRNCGWSYGTSFFIYQSHWFVLFRSS